MSETYTGKLGFVILPDTETAERSETLGIQYGGTMEFHVPAIGAHITLYQAELKEVPRVTAQALLAQVHTIFRQKQGGYPFTLRTICPYKTRPTWLFWNVETISEEFRLAQSVSMGLSAWVNRELHPAQPIQMDESPLERNTRLFGTTNVGAQWPPHITLAYDEQAFQTFEPQEDLRQASVEKVAFVRFGQWGKIDEILFSL